MNEWRDTAHPPGPGQGGSAGAGGAGRREGGREGAREGGTHARTDGRTDLVEEPCEAAVERKAPLVAEEAPLQHEGSLAVPPTPGRRPHRGDGCLRAGQEGEGLEGESPAVGVIVEHLQQIGAPAPGVLPPIDGLLDHLHAALAQQSQKGRLARADVALQADAAAGEASSRPPRGARRSGGRPRGRPNAAHGHAICVDLLANAGSAHADFGQCWPDGPRATETFPNERMAHRLRDFRRPRQTRRRC